MISAWARMCKIMGKEFEQYLPLVMGPVLKAAQIKPEVALVDSKCPVLFLSLNTVLRSYMNALISAILIYQGVKPAQTEQKSATYP